MYVALYSCCVCAEALTPKNVLVVQNVELFSDNRVTATVEKLMSFAVQIVTKGRDKFVLMLLTLQDFFQLRGVLEDLCLNPDDQ